MMRKRGYRVSLETGATPDKFELKVAYILLGFFESNIRILKSSQSRTPDLLVLRLNQRWEIKNIRGNGKHTIEHNLSNAGTQSKNIIISLLRSNMRPDRAIGYVKRDLKNFQRGIKKVVLVTKAEKVIVIK